MFPQVLAIKNWTLSPSSGGIQPPSVLLLRIYYFFISFSFTVSHPEGICVPRAKEISSRSRKHRETSFSSMQSSGCNSPHQSIEQKERYSKQLRRDPLLRFPRYPSIKHLSSLSTRPTHEPEQPSFHRGSARRTWMLLGWRLRHAAVRQAPLQCRRTWDLVMRLRVSQIQHWSSFFLQRKTADRQCPVRI
jgi:hypothetical protein